MRIKEISEKVQKTSSKTLVIQNNLIPLFHNNQEKRFTSNYTKKGDGINRHLGCFHNGIILIVIC